MLSIVCFFLSLEMCFCNMAVKPYIKEAKYRITEQKRKSFLEPKNDQNKTSKVEPIVTELLGTVAFKIHLGLC